MRGVCHVCLVLAFLPRSWAKERYDIIRFCFLCVYSEQHSHDGVFTYYVEFGITEDSTPRHICLVLLFFPRSWAKETIIYGRNFRGFKHM